MRMPALVEHLRPWGEGGAGASLRVLCTNCIIVILTDMTSARHHHDLIMCRKQPGISIGRTCQKCDGKCVICDSFVRATTLVRICDECNYGSMEGRCVVCGMKGVSDAYYCRECVITGKDRDGCPKIINLGSARVDLFYERRKYAFKPK